MTRLLTSSSVLGLCLAACSSSTAPPTTPTPTGVAIAPSGVTLQTGQVLQFSVIGGYGQQFSVLAGQGFSWRVAGTGCSGAGCGTIDATGRYTAPATVPDPALVTVTASSVVDSTKSLETTVTLSPTESFSIDATSVEFGKQMVDTTSAPRAITVTNTGSTPQPVHGRINAGQWPDFALTHDCPSTLAVGAGCTFNITFTPSGTGDRRALLLLDGTFDEEGIVNVAGMGTR